MVASIVAGNIAALRNSLPPTEPITQLRSTSTSRAGPSARQACKDPCGSERRSDAEHKIILYAVDKKTALRRTAQHRNFSRDSLFEYNGLIRDLSQSFRSVNFGVQAAFHV